MSRFDKPGRLERLFTAAVLGQWGEVRRQRRAAQAPEPDREWRETLLQVHLFAGFPRMVQAFDVLAEEGGAGLPAPEELEPPQADAQAGAALFDTIYGEGAGRVRAHLAGQHPDLALWIAEHAYARVLARPGLEAARREVLACCALTALGQGRQLASHARGALRCGAGYEELAAALRGVSDLVGPERLERGLRIVERFRDESAPRD